MNDKYFICDRLGLTLSQSVKRTDGISKRNESHAGKPRRERERISNCWDPRISMLRAIRPDRHTRPLAETPVGFEA